MGVNITAYTILNVKDQRSIIAIARRLSSPHVFANYKHIRYRIFHVFDDRNIYKKKGVNVAVKIKIISQIIHEVKSNHIVNYKIFVFLVKIKKIIKLKKEEKESLIHL